MFFHEMLLLGFFAGTLGGLSAGLLGVGGGAVMLPALIQGAAWLGEPTSSATPWIAPILIMILLSSGYTWYCQYHRGVRVEPLLWKKLLPGLLVGIGLGHFGLVKHLSDHIYPYAFSTTLIFLLFWQHQKFSPTQQTYLTKYDGLIGVLAGITVPLFGLGGGLVFIPWLYARGLMGPLVTTTSASLTCLGAGAALCFKYTSLEMVWPVLLGMIIAVFPTVRLGVFLTHYLSPYHLKHIFSAWMIAMAIWMPYALGG